MQSTEMLFLFCRIDVLISLETVLSDEKEKLKRQREVFMRYKNEKEKRKVPGL